MTGLLVPLYIYPGSEWNTLITIKTTYPSLPIVAIIDPDSSPGTTTITDYVVWISKLKAVDIIVVGYDYTNYGTRPLTSVAADIDTYHTYYPNIDGIFFDQMQYLNTENETYYSNLGDYAKSKGFSVTFGNPGSKLPVSYMSTMDYIVVFENTYLADLTAYEAYSTYSSQLAMISTNQTTLPTSWVNSTTEIIEWLYVTDDSPPNPYDTLPNYLSTLAQLLNTANINLSSSTSTVAEDDSDDSDVNFDVIIGIIVGGLGLFVIVFCILSRILHEKKRLKKEKMTLTPMRPVELPASRSNIRPVPIIPSAPSIQNTQDTMTMIEVTPRCGQLYPTTTHRSLLEIYPLKIEITSRDATSIKRTRASS